MKCLQKDRAYRYATANGLAMDVKRYLDQEPITARPPSSLYRLSKTFRRHRFVMLAGAALVTALVGGVIVSTWQAVRATRAEHEQTLLRQEIEAELNRQTGEFSAKRGRWREAVPYYQQAIQLIPSRQEYYHHLVPLLAELGDLPLYDETCQHALESFRQTTEPRVAERMTKDCLILSSSKIDPEELSQLMEVAIANSQGDIDLPWYQLAKALAEYRCGRYANALIWLEQSLATAEDLATDPGRIYVQVQGRAVLAMAQSRVGRHAEAQATLGEARLRARDHFPKLDMHGLTDYWPDWIYARILLREVDDQLANSL